MWHPPSSQASPADNIRRRGSTPEVLRALRDEHQLERYSREDPDQHGSNLAYEIETASATDHNGDKINIAWMRPSFYYMPLLRTNFRIDRETYEAQNGKFPAFPVQVYILTSATQTLQNEEFRADFAKWLDVAVRKTEVRAHFEFYSTGLHDVFACLAHQRKEITMRRNSGGWPHLPWHDSTNASRHDRFVLIVESDEWKTNGVTLVHLTQDAPSFMDYLGRDKVDLRATRICKPENLTPHLHAAWEQAGGHLMQQELNRLNEGCHSPVRYPAADPVSHRDAHHEQLPHLPGIGGDHVATFANVAHEAHEETAEDNEDEEEEDDDDDDYYYDPLTSLNTTRKELNAATRRDLYKSSKDLPHLKTDKYEGHAGWEATSVWNSMLSKTRPSFVITMYLCSDLLPFTAPAVFALLNRDDLHKIPWTLDIVRNVPNIESAFRHYSHEARHRKPARCQSRPECQKMFLGKIAGAILPEELLQVIEDMIDIPAVSGFSPPPWKGFHDKFLYLDGSTQTTGPRIVRFNHSANTYVAANNGQELVQPSTHTSSFTAEETPNFVITNPNYWILVSDEIHTDWTLCSPRLEVPARKLPQVSIRLHLPENCVWNCSDREFDGHHWPKASLALHASKPITILHTQDPVCSRVRSDLMLEGAFEFLDLTTNRTIDFPTTSHALPPFIARRECTWSQRPFVKYECRGTFNGPTLHTIEPGAVHTVRHEDPEQQPLELLSRSFWEFAYSTGRLQHGHDYVIRVKPGFTIPRWTYGSVPDLEGPYNLPPVAVHGENECRFKFLVKKDLRNASCGTQTRTGMDLKTILN